MLVSKEIPRGSHSGVVLLITDSVSQRILNNRKFPQVVEYIIERWAEYFLCESPKLFDQPNAIMAVKDVAWTFSWTAWYIGPVTKTIKLIVGQLRTCIQPEELSLHFLLNYTLWAVGTAGTSAFSQAIAVLTHVIVNAHARHITKTPFLYMYERVHHFPTSSAK